MDQLRVNIMKALMALKTVNMKNCKGDLRRRERLGRAWYHRSNLIHRILRPPTARKASNIGNQ